MKSYLTLLIAAIVAIVLLAYMFCFQVRYDQVAVVTTFEKAVQPTYDSVGSMTEPGSIVRDAGLHARLPWPIQNVHVYPTQIQILDDSSEEQTTADSYNVIIKAYLTWRIEDPYAFFVSVKTTDEAAKKLQPLLREIRGIFGKYRFDQLVNTDPKQLKIAEVETEALKTLQARLAAIKPSYGIKVEHLGIRRIVLPERVTEAVFARMKSTRERLAADIRFSGNAEADAIRSEATSAQKTILSFAQSRADAIRSEGIRQASASYKVFDQDPQFAVFLAQLEALKKMLKNNATFVLSASGPLELFAKEPGAPASTAAAKP